MADAKWSQVKEIFDAVLQRKPEERAEFLDEACDGNHTVRHEVESLLSSFGRADGFMEKPAFGGTTEEQTVKLKALATGQTLGHYEIIRQIGGGGMGEVYLARDKKLDRNVAIKILNQRYENNESNIQRFIQEAKAASALNHPNILVIHEISETEESHYIVSELIEGKTLRDVLNEESPTLAKILDIAVQITGALAAAHAARIIHRDIKPENIIVRNDGYVKVVDFGLAKLLSEATSFMGLDNEMLKQNQTAKGLILGTVNYMSPEQARAEKVDERTDIFSLGVLIYEMITGRTPFTGDSMSDTFANLINKEPPPISRFTAGVPDELQRIVTKTLRKNRDDRYQTMKGMLADLKELKENLSFGEKLERSKPPDQNETAVLYATTGEANKQTLETQHSLSQKIKSHKPLAVIAAIVLLASIIGLGYWYFGDRTTSPQIKTLAVLPLRSLDAGENLIGFGIADAVIRRISQTGKLTIRPTSAVRRYLTEETDALTAANQLTTDAILEGTVQRSGDRLRVSVNLLRTSDGASLWAESFDTQASDVFAIQDTVSQQVASRLNLKLDPAQQARLAKRITSNPIAYEFYTRGVHSFDQRGWGPQAKDQNDVTIDFFKQAIEAEPGFALAHAELAQAYNFKGLYIVAEEQERWCRLAEEEIRKAEELDPQLPETHLARGALLFGTYGGYQVAAAVREFLLAQQLDPNLGHLEVGEYISHIGIEDVAERELLRAYEIDPTSKYRKNGIIYFYINSNRWDDYLAAKEKYFPEAPISYGYYLAKGDLAKAEALIAEEENPLWKADAQAFLYALRGDKKASEDIIPEIQKHIDPRRTDYHHVTYDIACIYAINGNVPEAVKWLRETATKGNPSYLMFTRDPWLDKIRQSPEFIQFMSELKPQYEKYRSEFR